MNAESLNLSTSRGASTAYVTRPHEKVDAGVLLVQPKQAILSRLLAHM